MVRNNRKKNKAPPRDDPESGREQVTEHGEDEEVQVVNNTASNDGHDDEDTTIQEDIIAAIMKNWNLEPIVDVLPIEFSMDNANMYDLATLQLLLDIATHERGLGWEEVRDLIQEHWNQRSNYSLDHPTGHRHPKDREEYLREDLQLILVLLKIELDAMRESAQALRDTANDEPPQETSAEPAPGEDAILESSEEIAAEAAASTVTTKSQGKKRNSEDTEFQSTAKRQKSASPPPPEAGEEQLPDNNRQTRIARLLADAEPLWGDRSAVDAVGSSMRRHFRNPVDPTTWGIQILEGLLNIGLENARLAEADRRNHNQLSNDLWEAYKARTRNANETLTLTTHDTDAVIQQLRGYMAVVPRSEMHGSARDRTLGTTANNMNTGTNPQGRTDSQGLPTAPRADDPPIPAASTDTQGCTGSQGLPTAPRVGGPSIRAGSSRHTAQPTAQAARDSNDVIRFEQAERRVIAAEFDLQERQFDLRDAHLRRERLETQVNRPNVESEILQARGAVIQEERRRLAARRKLCDLRWELTDMTRSGGG